MPLKHYGVLKGRPIGRQLASGANPHYQIHLVDDTTDYRIAVNVASQMAPSEVEYLIEPAFRHPYLPMLDELASGWTELPSRAGGPALDFIRSNLFDSRRMVPLPFNVAGPDNDLNDKLDGYIQRAMADEDALVYAFGERWGPEAGKKDKIFGFAPGNGVHDIHMNQANAGRFAQDDGVYQDGALLIHFPYPDQWVAIFLKFQSQTWHSDDQSGHRIDASAHTEDGDAPHQPEHADGRVRIVAALANALHSPETETVTLLNVTPETIDLGGWTLVDRDKHRQALSGQLPAGATLQVTLQAPVMLPNKGGLISVLDADGLRVDGVSYTREDASQPGYTIKF
ncbi:DUF2278 family protein [Chitinibacteraceae bacterium HSL-7]